MKKLLIISGQTATGKTDLGIYLAKKFNGEIVSFDSRQAYRYLDLITGKISNIKYQKSKTQIKNQKFFIYKIGGVPVWLYDLVDPKEYLNAYDFCQKGGIVINDILKRKKLPIIVGGTVFYIKSFLEGFETENIEPDWQLRKSLEKLTVEELQNKLKQLNKERFLKMNRSDRNNKRRLIRAIEINQIKNKKLKMKNHYLKLKKDQYNYLFLALILEKTQLKERVKERVNQRIKEGAIEEVEKVLKKGYCFSDPGLNTIGYKQLKDYFQNKISLEKAVDNWIKAEVDYSRRQLVFLKKINNRLFLNPKEKNFLEKTEKLVYKWLNDSEN